MMSKPHDQVMTQPDGDQTHIEVDVQHLNIENMNRFDANRFKSRLDQELTRKLSQISVEGALSFTQDDGQVITLTSQDFSSPDRLARAIADLITKQIRP